MAEAVVGDNRRILKKRTHSLPEVNFSDEGPLRHLHLGTEWIQGTMIMDAPTLLFHEYIQRMMAWLLFVEPDTVTKRQAMQLGLGAGSLTKFCAKELRMKTTAIELNPQVLLACRGWFKLPADNSRMQVVLADAALEIENPKWWGTVDALQVDLYDHEAAAPVLDSLPFYNHCNYGSSSPSNADGTAASMAGSWEPGRTPSRLKNFPSSS